MFALSPVSNNHINRRRRLSALLRQTNNLLVNERGSSDNVVVGNRSASNDIKETKKKRNAKTTSKKVNSSKRSSRSVRDTNKSRSSHRRKNRRNEEGNNVEDAKVITTTTIAASPTSKHKRRSCSVFNGVMPNDDSKNRDDDLQASSHDSLTSISGSNRRRSSLLGNYLQNISNRSLKSLSNFSSCEFDANNDNEEDDISIHSTATGDSYVCTGNIVVDLDASDHFVAPALQAGHDSAPASPTRSSIRSLASSISAPSLTITSSRQAKLLSLDRYQQDPQDKEEDQSPSTPSSRSRRMTLRQSMLQRYNDRLSITLSSHCRRSSLTATTSSSKGSPLFNHLPFGDDDDDDVLKKNRSVCDDFDDDCSETLVTYDESSSSNTMDCWSSNAPLSPSFSNHHRLASTMDFSHVASSSGKAGRDFFCELDTSEQQELLQEEVLEMESVLKVLQEALGFDPVETVGSRHPSFTSSSSFSSRVQMTPPPPPPSPGMLSVISSVSNHNKQITPSPSLRPQLKSLHHAMTKDEQKKRQQVEPRRSLSNVTQSTESTASSSSSTADVALELPFCDELSCTKEEEDEGYEIQSKPEERAVENHRNNTEVDAFVRLSKFNVDLTSSPEAEFKEEGDEIEAGKAMLQREIQEMELVMKVLKEKIGFNPVATVGSRHPSFVSSCPSLPMVQLPSSRSSSASPSIKNSKSLTLDATPIVRSKNDGAKGELKAVMDEMESILLTMKLEEASSSRKDKSKKKKKKSSTTTSSPESTSSKIKKKKRPSKTANKRTSNSTLSTASLSSHSAHSS